MNRKILAAVLVAAMAISSMAMCASADGTDGPPTDAAEDTAVATAPAGTPAYARHDAVVKEVTDGAILLDIGEEQPETATVSAETVFLTAAGETTDASAVKAGDKVSVFVDGDAAVPLIYPAEYPASCVVLGDGENYAGVDIDAYAKSDSLGMYLNGAKTLAINVDEQTSIVTANGSRIYIDYTDLAGRTLAVFYDVVTMSIPGIANPTKVVVLGDAKTTEKENAARVYGTYIDLDRADAVTHEDVVFIPVRKYAESLGYEVTWTPEAPTSVAIGTVPMGVVFELGVNSYTKAKMTPFVLEAAPFAANGTTYVPVSFFEQVLEVGVKTPRG